MEFKKNEIVIRLHFESEDNKLNSKFLIQSLKQLEDALFESNKKDIEDALDFVEIPFPDQIKFASIQELKVNTHQQIYLNHSEKGSVVIYGIVTGVSLFVLEKTIGESFAVAWKESESHKKLIDFFKKRINKIDSLLKMIQEKLKPESSEVDVRKSSAKSGKDPFTIIDISLIKRKKRLKIKSWSEILEEELH